jgi:hypothetical protein
LAGTWAGSGQIDLQNGRSERIRCRANNAVGDGGNTMQQELRCASDSFHFDVNSNVESSDGAITGTWSETSRNISGQVSGRAAAGRIQARVNGGAFSAGLTMNGNGNSQAVTIVPVGTDVKGVAVMLKKDAATTGARVGSNR